MRKPVLMPVLLALLMAALCLIQLSGCAEKNSPDTEPVEPVSAPDLVSPAPADGPLTEEELRYFNEEFFNGDGLNIRNQFLSSAYYAAADVNLFELFYNGDGQEEIITDEERSAFEAAGGFADTDIAKISTAGADAVLKEHTGLTLAKTSQVGLENFIYLPEYDAYYLAHGDTNYLNVTITGGERKEGLICLYYPDEFSGDTQKCVTLRQTADGAYQFVSNLSRDEPVS